MATECNICLEKYNKKITIDKLVYLTGNKITCIKCNYSTCTYCTKKVLLNSANDARCMNCKHPWDREFLINNFTKVFINKDYKKHREDTLFDRETALIPTTMNIINQENQINDLKKQKEEFRKKMETQLYDYDVNIWNLENSSGKTKRDKNKFIKKCTSQDCKGFLSSQWKCGLCECYTCKHCHEVIGKRIHNDDRTTQLPPHECNEDNIKTAQLLTKECKNCPKCASPIYKIDGCSQMWCTECRTAFSWKTGEIITGHFHNPHYYEWLRQNNDDEDIPREPGDNPCEVPYRQLLGHINNILFQNYDNHKLDPYVNNNINFKTDSSLYFHDTNFEIKRIITFFESLHRFINHINDITITDIDRTCLINDDNHLFNSNLFMRKWYLKDKCTPEEFKKDIQKNEKKRLKLIDRKQIYQTFTNVSNDILRKILSYNDIQQIIDSLNEICNITNHINDQLSKHKKIYNCVTDYIKIYPANRRYFPRTASNRAKTHLKPCIDIKFHKLHDIPNYSINDFKIIKK